MTVPNEIQEMIADVTARLDLRSCHGCDECGTRCVEGIGITQEEFTALVDYLEAQPPEEVRRVLGQDKEFPWGSGTVRACLFRDTERRNCFVYPVRPLICRLFGFVAWLPCPLGEVAQVLPDGLEIIHWYRQFDRRTFREWVQEDERVQKLLRGLEVSVKCET
jgi:Fe-S-cluster containining protein